MSSRAFISYLLTSKFSRRPLGSIRETGIFARSIVSRPSLHINVVEAATHHPPAPRFIASMPPKNKFKATKTTRTTRSSKTLTALSKNISNQATPSTQSDMPVKSSAANPAEAPNQEPVYFWKPHEVYGFLGQWYESEWEHEGSTYVTAEMWMMVGKARLFGDEMDIILTHEKEIAKQMLETTDPKWHKALGRQVANFDPKKWDAEKLRIVEEGNYFKFTKSKEADTLRQRLIETGERELVEASPMDKIWGVGFGEKNAGKNRHRWGQNLLGKALMNVRKRLVEESNES